MDFSWKEVDPDIHNLGQLKRITVSRSPSANHIDLSPCRA